MLFYFIFLKYFDENVIYFQNIQNEFYETSKIHFVKVTFKTDIARRDLHK